MAKFEVGQLDNIACELNLEAIQHYFIKESWQCIQRWQQHIAETMHSLYTKELEER